MRTLFLMLLLVCGISSAYGEEKQQPQGTKTYKAGGSPGSQNNPFFVKRQKSAEETKGEAEQDADAKANLGIQRDSLKVSEKSLIANEGTFKETKRAASAAVVAAVIAALGAAIGVVMLWVAWYQLKMFREQLGAMKAAETRAEKEAKDRAQDTEKQLKISGDAAKAALMQASYLQQSTRAYMLESGEYEMKHDGGLIEITLRIKNFGKTPAKRVRAHFHMEDFPMPYNGPFDGPNWDNASETTIGPDAYLHQILTAKKPIAPAEFARLTNGVGGLYIWGDILYEDIFGKERHTKVRRVAAGADFAACRLGVCKDGNEAT